MSRERTAVNKSVYTDVDERLDDIDEQARAAAGLMREQVKRIIDGRTTVKKAESVQACVQTMAHLWDLEVELLRRPRRRSH